MNEDIRNNGDAPSGLVSDRLPDRVDQATPAHQSSRSVRRFPGIDSLAVRETPAATKPVGKRQLDVIADSLSTRDRAVLASLRQHRFLTTSQIERWHFAEHTSDVSAGRTCRRVLSRLRRHGLVASLERRLGGVRAGSASYIWHLTPAGHRLLGDGSGGRRVREPSATYLAHELGIAETHVVLLEAARAGRFDLIDTTSEPACWRTFLGAGGQPITLKPDLWAVTGSGEFEDVWFIEYDRGTESLPTITKKAGVYEAYRATGLEQKRSGVFPRVLWIAPTEQRATRIAVALGRTAAVAAEVHLTTTPERLVETVTTGGDGGAS